MMTKEDLLCSLLGCGIADIDVITSIDDDIVEEAVKELGGRISFPDLYYECARIGLEKVGIPEKDAEIDCNYLCAHIWISNHRRKAKALEKLGFSVTY